MPDGASGGVIFEENGNHKTAALTSSTTITICYSEAALQPDEPATGDIVEVTMDFPNISAVSITVYSAQGDGSTNGEGSNAIFATGDSTVVRIADLIVQTLGNFSHGLNATYGVSIVAQNVTITTAGDHCAAAAS